MGGHVLVHTGPTDAPLTSSRWLRRHVLYDGRERESRSHAGNFVTRSPQRLAGILSHRFVDEAAAPFA